MDDSLRWREEFSVFVQELEQRRLVQGVFFSNGDRVALEYLRLLRTGKLFTGHDVIAAVAHSMPRHALDFNDSPDKPAAHERWAGYVRSVEKALLSDDPRAVLRVYNNS